MARFIGLLCLFTAVTLSEAKHKAFVIVADPTWDDTVGYVAHVPWLKDYKIIHVQIKQGVTFSYQHGAPVDFYRKFTYGSTTPDAPAANAEICPQLKELDVHIEAVIPTSDPTVALTDQLAHCLGVRGNPAFGPLAAARRDKWVMGEAIRKAGMRSVMEKKVSTWVEAEAFLQTWNPPLSPKRPMVFKILQGVAGGGVFKADTMAKAKTVFDTNFQGMPANFQVMVQEYLAGQEFAVDSVSRDGVHKVIAVWFEDFRPANGIFDQYFGFKMLDPEDPKMKAIVAYGAKALDTLGVYNGAANMEIKWLDAEQQPCLVEVNARWAGINWHDGLAVEEATVGQNQITAAFESYLHPKKFHEMPAVRPLKRHGAVVFAINYEQGILKGVPGIDFAKTLKSYYDSDIQVPLNKPLGKTTPGTIPVTLALVHDDAAVVDADYQTMLNMEAANRFFDIAPEMASASLVAQRIGRTAPTLQALLLLAVGIGGMVAVASVSLRRAKDDTEYMQVE